MFTAIPRARSQDVFCRPVMAKYLQLHSGTALFSFVVCWFFEIITVRDEAVGCASGRERQYSPAKNVVTRKKGKSISLTLRILYSGSVLNGRPTD
jgi:hypothetical protein